jgi:hypothetical protein
MVLRVLDLPTSSLAGLEGKMSHQKAAWFAPHCRTEGLSDRPSIHGE